MPDEHEGHSNSRLIFIAAVAAVVLVAIAAAGIGLVVALSRGSLSRGAVAAPAASPSPGAPTPVTTASAIAANQGRVVFSDDFHDSESGWWVSSKPGATGSYSGGAYITVVSGAYDWSFAAPYTVPHQQLAVSVTATLNAGAAPEAGFGVDCFRGSGAAQALYEFIVLADSHWLIERQLGSGTVPKILKSGSLGSAAAPGVIPVTVQGLCATMPNGGTTRLALFVDGSMLADLTDVVPTLADPGWLVELDVSSSDTKPTTASATRFELRDPSLAAL